MLTRPVTVFASAVKCFTIKGHQNRISPLTGRLANPPECITIGSNTLPFTPVEECTRPVKNECIRRILLQSGIIPVHIIVRLVLRLQDTHGVHRFFRSCLFCAFLVEVISRSDLFAIHQHRYFEAVPLFKLVAGQ